MGRNKLRKFKDITNRENVFERCDQYIKGNWVNYFKNNNPIILEIACGQGEYTIGLARQFKNKNIIGVDIKGHRIWTGSEIAIKESLHNAAFLRTQVSYIENFFMPNEVDEIWIIFPDPRPSKKDTKRRLTSLFFLDIYKNMMKPGGKLHVKTDNNILFEYTLEVLKQKKNVSKLRYTFDLYRSKYNEIHLGIKTKYEHIFDAQGCSIKYLQCQLNK